MTAREKGGRVVFIGNIPYGVSEEQICDIFGRVGQVVNFRLVYDKETQRPKGFGFLEYTDVDAAASAVRNLNEFEVMGRTLRVDYSNDNGGGKNKDGGGGGQDGGGGMGGGGGRAPPPAHFSMGGPPPPVPQQVNGGGMDGAALPPLPPGADIPPSLSAPDAISKTLATIPPSQLLDIIGQMKGLAGANPGQATALLSQAPQLGYAIFQALLLLGLVDTNILGSLISQTTQGPPPPQVQQQQQLPPPAQMPYGMPPQGPPPPQAYAQPPAHLPQQQYGTPLPPPQYQQPPPPLQHYAPTPPVQQPAYQPPPPQQQQAPPAIPPGQEAVIQQILSMTREQIFALDDGPRNQILALRQQFGAPVH